MQLKAVITVVRMGLVAAVAYVAYRKLRQQHDQETVAADRASSSPSSGE